MDTGAKARRIVTARNGSGLERFRFRHGLFLDQFPFRGRIPIAWMDFLVPMICHWTDDFVFGNSGQDGSGGKSLISKSNFGHQWNHISLGGWRLVVEDETLSLKNSCNEFDESWNSCVVLVRHTISILGSNFPFNQSPQNVSVFCSFCVC